MAIDYSSLQARAGILPVKVNLLTGEEFLLDWVPTASDFYLDVMVPGPWRVEFRAFVGPLTAPGTLVAMGINQWDGAGYSHQNQPATLVAMMVKK